MKGNLDDRGFVRLVFSIALFVAAVFVLFSFGKPYYRFYTLQSYAKDEMLIEVGNVDTIRQKVLGRAAELGVPLDAGNLEVTKNDVSKVVTVKAHWSEVVDFWGYYRKKLNFKIDEAY